MAPDAALCLVMDLGDGSGFQMRVHRTPGEVAVTAYHHYRTGTRSGSGSGADKGETLEGRAHAF